MPRLVEMSTIVERCQRRADKESDDHISAAEWLALISEVYACDVVQVVADTGLRYFETTATLTTTGAAYVSEPSGIAKTVRLDYIDSSNIRHEVQEVNSHEQAGLSALTGTVAVFYALVDDRIYLYPTPATGQTYELLYVPQSPDTSEYASDVCLDLVNGDGEACLYWGVAALALAKAKQDASLHIQMQEKHRDRLQGWAADRAITQARRQHAADEYAERYGYEEGDYR
jgi:hypothetical protein